MCNTQIKYQRTNKSYHPHTRIFNAQLKILQNTTNLTNTQHTPLQHLTKFGTKCEQKNSISNKIIVNEQQKMTSANITKIVRNICKLLVFFCNITTCGCQSPHLGLLHFVLVRNVLLPLWQSITKSVWGPPVMRNKNTSALEYLPVGPYSTIPYKATRTAKLFHPQQLG